MRKGFKISFSCLFLLFCSQLHSQENLTLYHMHAIPQAMYQNPGIMPASRVNIGLPGISSIYGSFSNSGFKYSDLVKRRSDDSLVFTIDNMLDKLSPSNYFVSGIHADAFSLGFRVKRNYFSMNVTARTESYFRYPKDFMTLLLKGNAAFLGTEAAFNFSSNTMAYAEYGLSFTHLTKDEKFSIGARFKLLSGIADVETKRADISLVTNADTYALTAKSDILINAASIDTGSNSAFHPEKNIFGNNKGWGFDFGFQYKISKRLAISASILDVGSINWQDTVVNYRSAHAGTVFNFNGFDIKSFFNSSNGTQHSLDSLGDTLKHIFDLVKTKKAYSTSLTTKIYLGATYQLTRGMNAGIVLYGQYFDNEWHTSGAVSLNTRLGKILSASVSYGVVNSTMSNIGFGIALNPGPFQVYAVTDNILPVLQPENAKNTNVRVGLNFIFAKMKNASLKPGEDAKELEKSIAKKKEAEKQKVLDKEKRKKRQLEKD